MKIHMTQVRGLTGWGWTRCGRGMHHQRTGAWKRVTCKQCITHRK